MDKQDARRYGAAEDLKRMRVYEPAEEIGFYTVSAMQNNIANQYRNWFGIEPRRREQLRRMLEEAAQYGNRDFTQAIDEANKIPDRFPAQPYEPLFYQLDEKVGQDLLLRIQENEELAKVWEQLEKDAAHDKNPYGPRQRAGECAIAYIGKVGIDPSSRTYWIELYEKFFEWNKTRNN